MNTMTFVEMDFDTWMDTYRPVLDERGDIRMFETYGEDLEFLQQQDYHHVWTYLSDGDYDSITNGFRFVNRLCYYMTQKPWEGEDSLFSVTWGNK
jgi:hypothetical protein